MSMTPSQANDLGAERTAEVSALYRELLACWNNRNADTYASLFTEDGNLVGFDGSPVNGRTEIREHLSDIFADHPTAAYVEKVREVRFLAPTVAVLRAVAGMVPPGTSDLNPAANTIHTLVAAKDGQQWRVAAFQSTPAAFHGRPDVSERLTNELREVLQLRTK